MTRQTGRVELAAPAKVNLYLKITGRREDGYHEIQTYLQKISLSDRIEMERRSEGVTLRCPDSDLPENEENLAFRAAELFMERFAGLISGGAAGVAITLRKSIPVAAGLGGGSSDAAAVLRGMHVLFGSFCSEEELLELGGELGADVPFFVAGRAAAWATGRGDLLHFARPLEGYRMIVVNPGYSVSTKWVYENFALTTATNKTNLNILQNSESGQDLRKVIGRRPIRPAEMTNDLEPVTSSQYREIDIMKEALLRHGAVAAMMSGSGPSVFGLFPEDKGREAAACEHELKKRFQFVRLVEPLQV
ncbi:MAG: 4-(cytidine 5'-diphospho)-2-C-methyl-D-erythritol kinase [Desulfobulbaceae bacterium]